MIIREYILFDILCVNKYNKVLPIFLITFYVMIFCSEISAKMGVGGVGPPNPRCKRGSLPIAYTPIKIINNNP